jgi:hypothetical protein
LDRFDKLFFVAQVGLVQAHVRSNIFDPPRPILGSDEERELVSFGEQPAGQVRSDETRPPGDDDTLAHQMKLL